MLEIPLSGIKKIEEIAKSSNEYISLSQGALRIGGIPGKIKEYAQTLMATDKTDYYDSCWGLKILREKLANFLSARYMTDVRVNNIIPTHGCIGGLSLLYLSILNPGDEVIVPEPAYPAYDILTQASRAQAVHVSMLKSQPHDNEMWELDVEKIKAATTDKTKIIIFSNPWNPLGIIVPQKTILELVAWCEQKKIFLIVDEAYSDYAFDELLTSIVPLVMKSDWVISANTFSKNFGMSGWRVGYLVVPERLNKALAGMQDALLNCLNNVSQHAAMYALDHQEIVQHFHTLVRYNRDMTMRMLTPLVEQGIISVQKPVGGFFAFFKTQEAHATDLCMNIVNNAKVTLVPGNSFGPSGDSFLRLCYARDTELLEKGLNRLVNFLGK
ncbi:pyridoxal phosphate-dependent aminotransferase [Candidatus Dependentiae bacterium]|jgi:aminotransferase|nr:pyridoxal phosphate-dependent aminotransferase [Candidatus Dependentiae bacterium]